MGSLFYLTITRPDLAYSVGVVSQFMDSRSDGQLIAAKRILRYVKSTLQFGLLYKPKISFSLYGFTDADCAGNAITRLSTTRYCFSLGSTVVSWCSVQHKIVYNQISAPITQEVLSNPRAKVPKTCSPILCL